MVVTAPHGAAYVPGRFPTSANAGVLIHVRPDARQRLLDRHDFSRTVPFSTAGPKKP